jgi:hypothetical protein
MALLMFSCFVLFCLASSEQFQSFDHIKCTNVKKNYYSLLLIKAYLGFIRGVGQHKAKDLCLIE